MLPRLRHHNVLKHQMKWMNVLIAVVVFVGLAVISTPARASGPGDTASIDPSRLIFSQYCQKCHAGPKHKGDFQIEMLSQDFSGKSNRLLWVAVMEHLKAGTMPPKGRPRPPAQDVNILVDWISGRAAAAEAARVAAEGRVVLRRLNRAEYVNTVRDLLGVDVDLADLLPPDTSTSGFDNSAESLHTSSYLMDTYLEAADRVLDAAIANRPRPAMINKRYDIKKERSVQATGSVYRHTDDGVAIFSSWVSANVQVSLYDFRTRDRGKYRFRISGYALQSNSKPVNFHVKAGTFKSVTE